MTKVEAHKKIEELVNPTINEGNATDVNTTWLITCLCNYHSTAELEKFIEFLEDESE